MESEDILSMLRRYGLVIVAHAVVGLLVGYALAMVTPPTYTSHATALVSANAGTGTQSVSSNNLATSIMPTVVELGTSDQVLTEVEKATSVPVPTLRSAVKVTTTTGSLIVAVDASGASPELAQQVARSTVDALRGQVGKMSIKVQQEEQTLTLTDIDTPSLPSAPSAPSTSRYALYGGIVGTALGGAITLVLFRTIGQRRDAAHADMAGRTEGDDQV